MNKHLLNSVRWTFIKSVLYSAILTAIVTLLICAPFLMSEEEVIEAWRIYLGIR